MRTTAPHHRHRDVCACIESVLGALSHQELMARSLGRAEAADPSLRQIIAAALADVSQRPEDLLPTALPYLLQIAESRAWERLPGALSAVYPKPPPPETVSYRRTALVLGNLGTDLLPPGCPQLHVTASCAAPNQNFDLVSEGALFPALRRELPRAFMPYAYSIACPVEDAERLFLGTQVSFRSRLQAFLQNHTGDLDVPLLLEVVCSLDDGIALGCLPHLLPMLSEQFVDNQVGGTLLHVLLPPADYQPVRWADTAACAAELLAAARVPICLHVAPFDAPRGHTLRLLGEASDPAEVYGRLLAATVGPGAALISATRSGDEDSTRFYLLDPWTDIATRDSEWFCSVSTGGEPGEETNLVLRSNVDIAAVLHVAMP